MNDQAQLALGISLAVQYHKNQFDKSGKPYILHPLHLMTQLLFDTQLATIAVLHDVIEDSDCTIEYLSSMGFSKRITDALDLLTHKPEDDYREYIRKISGSLDAIRVKRKDLQHNSDITRLKGVRQKDLDRIEKYHKAFMFLGEAKRNLLRVDTV